MSQNTVTYDLIPPLRPGIDDVGGGAKVNATQPPDPQRGLDAADWNQASKQLVELAAVVPVVVLAIKFTAGVPLIDQVTGAGTAAKNPATYTVTDNGAGDTTIAWPAGTFPGRTAPAKAGITGATVGMIAVETLTNSVRVRTLTSAAIAADLPFTLDLYGQ